MPVLVGGKIRRFDPQKVFHGAGDVVTLANLRGAGNGTLKRLLRGFGMGVQAHGDIGQKPDAQLFRVKDRTVGPDDTRAFQLLHPAQAGRGGKANPIRKLQIGLAGIARKFAQYSVVDVIYFRHLLRRLGKNPQECNPLRSVARDDCVMTAELFLALVGFAFVTSVTPGPNNMMLLASGVNFGLRRTVPHMLGISIGHSVMVFLVGLGLAGVFKALPPALTILKLASVAYMLWLAWKIAHSAAPGEGNARARPMTFVQAAGFQWVNPKAWAMALGAVAAYVPEPSVGAYLLVAVAFSLVNLPSITIWVMAGQGLRRWLNAPSRLRLFNWTMAVMLVLSLYPVLALEL